MKFSPAFSGAAAVTAGLFLAAVAAMSQTIPSTPPGVRPRPSDSKPTPPPAQKRAPAPTTAAVSSYKDLKYPPLGAIQIPSVDTFTLPNGVRLYLLEDHELPLVSGLALVRTGNLFDPADKIGLATMTGMVMRTGGTHSKTGDQLDVQLEDMAASVESSIGETSGTVSFSCLKENSGDVLAAFKDVLTAPEFRQDKIDLAKNQIRSGIARRNDDASGIAQREFADIVYGKNTPYGWQEEYATIDRIGRTDLDTFYRRYFFPKNTILAVWGDFDAAAMKANLEKLFADWTVEQPPVPDFPKVTATPSPGLDLAVKNDVTQTFFTLGHLGGEFRDKDYPALVILSDILGGGFQSRLMQRVRTKMGNAYDISADWGGGYDHPGLFEISGSTKSLSTVETIQAIQEEVARIRTSEVTEDELKSAKDTALNGLVFAYDTKSKTLRRLLTYEYYGYPKDFIQQYQKALAAVTRADVLRVAKEHINPAAFTILTVGNPTDFGRPLDELGSAPHILDLTIPEPGSTAAKADTASLEKGKQLLARAQQAAGGTEKLAAVKDVTQVAEFALDSAAGGMRLTLTNRWMAPSFFRQESSMPVGKITAFSNGKTGWIVTPQGSGVLAGPQLKQVQGDVFRFYVPLLLSDRVPGRMVNATGPDTVEIRDGDGQIAQIVFDAATGLPQKVLYQTVTVTGPPIGVESDYSDFREVSGIKVPFKTVILQGGKQFAAVTVTSYEVNTGLKSEDLEKHP